MKKDQAKESQKADNSNLSGSKSSDADSQQKQASEPVQKQMGDPKHGMKEDKPPVKSGKPSK